eukprot:TRINITY_DN23362_c0_g1_i1.p1 TRINITY_DN23362_c0_g1~~TRINITY_DN23362_c0_g1_i1.p1  ORF type:complete len:1220 (-),score=215.33 TRINITY_DN23362_c0_g1_i1:7-3666(-)
MLVFEFLTVLCCLHVSEGARSSGREERNFNASNPGKSKADDALEKSPIQVLQSACNQRYQLDKILPTEAHEIYAVRAALDIEDDIFVIGAESAYLDTSEVMLTARKENAREVSLETSGGYHCKELSKSGSCGRLRVKLRNVKVFKNGNAYVYWPGDTIADVSLKVKAHLSLLKAASCSMMSKLIGRCAKPARWKLMDGRTRIDFNILSLGRGVVDKALRVATWSGFLDRLVRKSVNAALKNLANSDVPIFRLPLDKVGKLEMSVKLKPSSVECLEPNSCLGVENTGEVSVHTGALSSRENLMGMVYYLESLGLNITGNPWTLEWLLSMSRPLLEGVRNLDVRAEASVSDDADGTQTITTKKNIGVSFSGSKSLKTLLEMLNLVPPEDFQAAYPTSEGWSTATFHENDGSSINLALQNARAEFAAMVKVAKAGQDGKPIWVVQTDQAHRLLISLDRMVCQRIPKIGPAFDFCQLLGGGVEITVLLDISATSSLDFRTIELCILEPCGGRRHLTPSWASVQVTAQNLQVKVDALDTIEVRLHVENSVKFLEGILSEAALQTSLHGPLVEGTLLPGSRQCSGWVGSRITSEIAKPSELEWEPGPEKRELDSARLEAYRTTYAGRRLLSLRLPPIAENPDAISWLDEAVTADLSLRIRPADQQTLESLCSKGQSILELQGKDGGPAEIVLTLKDPQTTSSILNRIFAAGLTDGLVSLRLALKLKFAVANGELQKCQCGCCRDEVVIEDISFKDSFFSNWLLGSARWLVDPWIQDVVGGIIPQALGPVVRMALRKHSIEGSDVALVVGLESELGGSDLVLRVRPKLQGVKLTPVMRAREIPTDTEVALDDILPAVGIRTFGEVLEIQPNILVKLIEPVMSEIRAGVPKNENVKQVLSVPVRISLANEDVRLELRDVYVSYPADEALQTAEVLAAQPTERATDDCFLEDRPIALLPRPHRVDDISKKVNLQAARMADLNVSMSLKLEQQGVHDFQHRLLINNAGHVHVNVQQLLRPLLNDAGTTDWGFAERDFGLLRVKSGSYYHRTRRARNVKLACGALYLDDSLQSAINLVDFEETARIENLAAKSKPCINVRDSHASYSICSGSTGKASTEDIDAISVLKSTLESEQIRQRSNLERMQASEACKEELTGGSEMIPNFEWAGLEKLSNVSKLAMYPCMRACGSTPACHTIGLQKVMGKVSCRYLPHSATAGLGVTVSKAWHLR